MTEDCRQAFEEECVVMSLPVGRTGDYDNKKTRLCWIFWQLAWKRAQAALGGSHDKQ